MKEGRIKRGRKEGRKEGSKGKQQKIKLGSRKIRLGSDYNQKTKLSKNEAGRGEELEE